MRFLYMNILGRIDELCQLHSISKYRLSQITGISQSAFSKMARQQSTLSLENLQRICDTFGISMAQFFSDSGNYPDLTPQQRELLRCWSLLNEKKRDYALLLIREMIDL